MPQSVNLEHLIFAAFPRSGNTMMRNLFEQIMGIYTGGNMSEKYELDVALKDKGFLGEYVRDNRVWIIYSHHPILSKYPFTGESVVIGVRYPFDVFDSFFNLAMTCSHTKTLSDD
jgi:hypothetical protein